MGNIHLVLEDESTIKLMVNMYCREWMSALTNSDLIDMRNIIILVVREITRTMVQVLGLIVKHMIINGQLHLLEQALGWTRYC